MMRNAIVVGDPTSTGGVVLPGPLTTGSIGGQYMAIIGGKATCPACGSTGMIAMSGGPYRETAHGHQIVLEGDIVVCKCPVPPKIISMSYPKAVLQDHAETEGVVSLTAAKEHAMALFLQAGSDGGSVFRPNMANDVLLADASKYTGNAVVSDAGGGGGAQESSEDIFTDGTITPKIFKNIEHGTLSPKDVNAIVLHRTGGADAASTLSGYGNQTVGAHFLIDNDGTIYQTAGLDKEAWHVGNIRSRGEEEKTLTTAESKVI